MTLDVFDDNDRVVHDQSDRKHNREQRKQIQREAEHLHQKERADQRYRNRDDGNDHGPKRSQEQKDDEHHDQQRVDERFYDFVNRVVDVSSCVISNFGLHTARQFFFDLLKLGADTLDHVDRVRVWQNVNAHEHRFLAGEAHFGVVILGAEHDVGDVADSNECAFVLLDHQLLELVRRVQIGIRGQIHLKQRTFRAANSSQKIIFGKRGANISRRNVQCGHAFGFHPNAHRERAPAKNVRFLHAAHGGESRLHQPDEKISDLVWLENVRGKTQIR